jgi:uncharacterized protein (DUF885 family)
VADFVSTSRGYFGTTMTIEGWAVHMEQRMREEGFYEGKELLFFAVCDAIRAARVILDIELHADDLDAATATRFVTEATLMPEPWARAQVLRARRIPLQGLNYLVGASEIAALRAEVGDDFYAPFLSLGPIPPSRARRLLKPE